MSFKRVISHDELGNLSKKMSTGGENEETNEQFAPNTRSEAPPVAVIETEPKEEKDKSFDSKRFSRSLYIIRRRQE